MFGGGVCKRARGTGGMHVELRLMLLMPACKFLHLARNEARVRDHTGAPHVEFVRCVLVCEFCRGKLVGCESKPLLSSVKRLAS